MIDTNSFSWQIKEMADQLRPSPKYLEQILDLRQRIKDWVIKEQWISRKYAPTVEVFGSTMSGLAVDGNAGKNEYYLFQ